MPNCIGIRKEDKNVFERRGPVVPNDVKKLVEEYEVKTILQPFPGRAFSAEEYIEAGAEIKKDLSGCPVILAVKEIPLSFIEEEKTYVFFSHTIKGQSYNMPLLKELMKKKCTLIDYECIKDENGRRLVFFGKYAGLAGMIDAFWGLGKRLRHLGFETTFHKVKQAYLYKDVAESKNHLKELASTYSSEELPNEFKPLVFAFSGYGNVSKGAQEIFDIFPHKQITPEELLNYSSLDPKTIYKVVFDEAHMFEKKDGGEFNLQEYFKEPEKYTSQFDKYLPYIDILVNAIYWDKQYPKLVTKKYLQENAENINLKLICDITCDINGSIEITYKSTMSDNPTYVYDPKTDKYQDGFYGNGVVDIAIDNLPCELPRDSSAEFSKSLMPFLPALAKADFKKSFEELDIPFELKNAAILHKGELTENYKYLTKFL
jgi:alpha-aminoadipic semialdehyde synthase